MSVISDKSKEDILKKDDVLKQYESSKETLELLVRKGEHPYTLSQEETFCSALKKKANQ